MKTIIAGSRTVQDSKNIYRLLDTHTEITEVVSGLAKGPDTIGKHWAEEKGIPIKEFPADWETHGKKAGYLRNIEMGDYADQLIAFWDGKSKGTLHMITYMKSLNKPVIVEEWYVSV